MTVMLIAVAVMLYYNRLWAAREKEADAASKNQTNRLAIILQTGKLSLWTYKIDERCYYSISETGDYTKEYNPIDFAQFFDRDDFELMRKAIFDISDEKTESKTLRIKGAPNAEGGQNSYDVNISVVERDGKGHAKTLLGVQHDVTDTLKREQEVSQLLMRYHTVFNSALSDMIYYDKDGRLSDINDKACKSFSTDDKRGLLFSNLRIQDNPIVFDSIDFIDADSFRQSHWSHSSMIIEDTLNIVQTLQGKGCLIVLKERCDNHTHIIIPLAYSLVKNIILSSLVQSECQ